MSDLNKRVGIIRVSNCLLEEIPEALLEAFKDIAVTDVKHELNGITNYKGFSKHFDILKDGEKIPYYEVIITKNNGKVIYKYVREKQTTKYV